jgi:hypothetical protein
MRWYTFTVSPNVHGPIVAENIRALAKDPLTRAILPPDAQVFRRRLENGERYFFSPSAVVVFEPFIKTYGGTECAPPLQNDVIPDDLLLLDLGTGGAWLPACTVLEARPGS